MGPIDLIRLAKVYKLIKDGIKKPSLFTQYAYWRKIFETLWSIKEIRDMLKGYKTYIVAALTAIVTLLHSLGYIDDAMYKALLALLGAGAVSTVAAKINRIQVDIDTKLNKVK
jgi:hypothetical protein